jgi:hypothetical protein
VYIIVHVRMIVDANFIAVMVDVNIPYHYFNNILAIQYTHENVVDFNGTIYKRNSVNVENKNIIIVNTTMNVFQTIVV